MDIVFRSTSTGFVSFGEGTIGRFELPNDSGGELRLTTVVTGLAYPRGIALQDDTRFVAELGPLPCEPAFPVCKGPTLSQDSPEAGERTIVRTSRGRVLAFRVNPDGALADRRVVLADLPFANTDHGVNDVAVGPDGRIFVSIGHVDLLYAAPALARDLRRPHGGLLGTVISFEPDGSDLQVYAKGLRNVYGLCGAVVVCTEQPTLVVECLPESLAAGRDDHGAPPMLGRRPGDQCADVLDACLPARTRNLSGRLDRQRLAA